METLEAPRAPDRAPPKPWRSASRFRRILTWYHDRRSSRRGWRRLRWRRIGTTLLALAGAAYFSAGTAGYCFLRFSRNVYLVRYWDVLQPWHWDRVRVAIGEHALAEAQTCFDDGKYREALAYVRVGLLRAPANRDGRLLDVKLEEAARQIKRARTVLLDGLPYHHRDPKYVMAVLTHLLQRQEDETVIALAEDYGGAAKGDPITQPLFALAAATACRLRGQYDRAEDLLHSVPRLADSRDGRLVSANINWDRGDTLPSLQQFRRLADEWPNDVELHHELVAHLRLAKQSDEARRRSLAFQIAHPLLAAPRVELLEAYHEAGATEHVAREADALLRDFAADHGVRLMLAEFAASSGNPALARRAAADAAVRKLPVDAYTLLTIEALVVAEDYRGALDLMHEFLGADPGRERRYHGLLLCLQGIANLGLHDDQAARVFFTEFLAQPNLRAENLLAIANRCALLGNHKLVGQILTRATEVDPFNQAALTRLVEFDLEPEFSTELPRHLQRLLTMRHPPTEILRVAQRKLGSDFYLFTPDAPAVAAAVAAVLARGE